MTFTHAFLYVCGIATGVLLYDVAIERQHPMPVTVAQPVASASVDGCSRESAAGRSLAASMVSSAAGDSVHDCYYR